MNSALGQRTTKAFVLSQVRRRKVKTEFWRQIPRKSRLQTGQKGGNLTQIPRVGVDDLLVAWHLFGPQLLWRDAQWMKAQRYVHSIINSLHFTVVVCLCGLWHTSNARVQYTSNIAQKTVAQIPLLTTKAGPRDGDAWIKRLKEEYTALIKVRHVHKSNTDPKLSVCRDKQECW